MKTNRTEPKDPTAAFKKISASYGPGRYLSAGIINGAVACIEPGPTYPEGTWAWFVGSDRAFLFGFERSKSWASRRMRAAMQREHLQIN